MAKAIVEILSIGEMCMQTCPCKHFCQVKYADGTTGFETLNAMEILGFNIPRIEKAHFAKYLGRL